MVPGGREAGAALASHPGVAKIALIGSVPTGKAVMRAAADTLKPVLLELGGKNALIAYPDADPRTTSARAIMTNVKGRWRPLIPVALFCGLRSSELRGLIWENVDLDNRLIHVRQRADKYGVIGAPKSDDGHRTVSMLPLAANAPTRMEAPVPQK